METTKYFFLNFNYVPVLAGLSAFILSTSFYLYPVIINVSRQKGLMDEPDNRKMHKDLTPTLGGLGVFIAFSLSIIFYGILIELVYSDLLKLLGLLGSAIILLFLGVKDDLIAMSPKKKFLGQLLAVLNVVILTDVRILSFEGLLGFGELPYFLSILFSVFVFILIINALNLIDGIDGLAGLISVISSLVFGILFFVHEYYLMTLISSILIGSILGFLRYNLSSNQKIFMGDCGSMLAGFLLAYQGMNLLTLNNISTATDMVSNAPVILLAILSYPLFDLLRVFAIRIKQGKSPFTADSNHIHHRLLRLGLDHKEATMILSVLSMLVIGSSFIFNDLEIHLHLGITVIIGALIYLSPFLSMFENIVRKEKKNSSIIPVSVLLENESKIANGIDSDSVIYSKMNNTNEAITDSRNNESLRLNDNDSVEIDNGEFKTIVRKRRRNLHLIKGKFSDKKSSKVKDLLEKK
jgi:UDP-N-acetylmuramyl pentapeptide phosphotransferase/UDP-N-acetylglucosamine-1-phosphate transferase